MGAGGGHHAFGPPHRSRPHGVDLGKTHTSRQAELVRLLMQMTAINMG
jgi:hypothetical protein